jgi:hypothetical protein
MKKPALLASLMLATLPLAAASGPGLAVFKPEPPSPAQFLAASRDGSELLLLGAIFDPTLREPDFAQVGLPAGVDGAYGIVQFKQGRIAARQALQAAGVEFVGYLPDNAYQVRLNNQSRALLAQSDDVRWLGPYKLGYKIHPRLWPSSAEAISELTLELFSGVSLENVQAALAAKAPFASPLQASDLVSRKLRYAVPAAERQHFEAEAAQISGVALIEPFDRPFLHNNDALAPIQSNVASTISANDCTTCSIFHHNITGTGQIAAVADTGNDDDMCFQRLDANPGSVTDFQTPVPPSTGSIDPSHKIIAYYVQPGATAYDNNATCPGGSPSVFHGTHTSATVVGDDFAHLSTPTAAGVDVGDGMAPNARLVFQDVGNDTTGCLSGLNDPYDMYLQALNAGARVHSNSYGASTAGAYTSDDAVADRFLFDHEDMTIFFSAGNSGPGAGTIGSPGNAKDVVTVGALNHGNNTGIAGFSSRGPTQDGRTKPDIMAPGSNTISASGDASHTDNNCGTKGLSGTSMACPTTAGGGALLRQYFEDGYYPSGVANPADALSAHASLVKAALLNGTLALPAGGVFGGNDFGWGRIFLDDNLFFSGDGRELRVWSVPNTDGLQTAGGSVYHVTVSAGQELRATLVWSDPEASPGAGATLVNNLNLSVNDGTTTYLGNVFNASGVSVPGGSADVVNNVEQVRLPAPAAGSYTISIAAPAVPGNGRAYTDRQGYALVVSYASCATAVAASPTALSAVNHVPMGVDLAWTNAAGSAVTQVYRAVGGCAAAAKDFQYVGSSAATSFTDLRAEGGVSYGYKVRGADGCGEGPASICVAITPSGVCDLVPTFGGLASAVGGYPNGTTCRVRLGWGAGSSNCPAGPNVLYDVYRSTTPNFTPAAGNLLTSVSGVTSYDDNDPYVVTDTTYYYEVRAEDSTTAGSGPNGGNQESNNLELFATALGPPGSVGTFADGAGDGHAYGSPESPWQVTATQAHSGTYSYHSGPDGSSYPPGVCAALSTPPLTLAAGAMLAYWARYNAEFQFDGTVVEISTNGGASWSDLPPTTPAGYPGALSQPGNACGYPTTQGAFSGPAGNPGLTPWTQYQTDLSAFAGQSVMIRWRFTSDGGVEFEGFFLDDVQITNVDLPGSCTPTPVELQSLSVR